MTTCQENDSLLALRASGDLAPEEVAHLDEHLAGCEACRAGLLRYQDVLALARLPVPEPRPGEMAVATLSAYRRARRRRVTGLTLGAGFAAAVVAAAVVLTPALLTLRSLPSQRRPAAVHASAGEVATPATRSAASDATSDDLTEDDVALAALDEADAP